MEGRRKDQSKRQSTDNKWEKSFKSEKNKYEKVEVVGNGAYGCVFKAIKTNKPNKHYAIKKIKHKKTEGFSITSLREIKLLKKIKHRNIVKLKEIRTSKRRLKSV